MRRQALLRWVLGAGTPNMNDTQRWLAGLRPRHNPAENTLIANMRDEALQPCTNMPVSACRMTPPCNRSFLSYSGDIDAGSTTIPRGTGRITQDEYDRKARELKEGQTEIAMPIERHQKGEGEFRTTLESLISLASRAA
jgi:hypothetical protein